MTSSRATSADSNPWRRSVSSAAGPVTWAVSPAPPLTMSRTLSVTSLMACCVLALIGMTVNAVPPSRETRPSGAPELNGTTGGSTPLTFAIFCRLGGDRLLVGVGQPAGAVIDRHGGGRLAAGEAVLDDLVGHDRGRVAGQEARDAVLGGVGELARQLAEHQQQQPEADDDPLRPAPAGPPRDRLQHRFTPPLPRACAALR